MPGDRLFVRWGRFKLTARLSSSSASLACLSAVTARPGAGRFAELATCNGLVAGTRQLMAPLAGVSHLDDMDGRRSGTEQRNSITAKPKAVPGAGRELRALKRPWWAVLKDDRGKVLHRVNPRDIGCLMCERPLPASPDVYEQDPRIKGARICQACATAIDRACRRVLSEKVADRSKGLTPASARGRSKEVVESSNRLTPASARGRSKEVVHSRKGITATQAAELDRAERAPNRSTPVRTVSGGLPTLGRKR